MIALMGMGLADLLCWVILLPALALVGYRTLAKSAERPVLIAKWAITVVLVLIILGIAASDTVFKPLFVAVPAVFLGLMWTSNVASFLFKPFTTAFDGGTEEVDAKPLYYAAEGKRRKGLPQEAVAEVRRQLDQFPGDVEGMMMLAEILARDLRDLPAATATIQELLQEPDLPPGKAVSALQTLADWQMQLGRDPAAARACFEHIIQLFPNSPFSHTAEQRIAHLEGVTKTRDFREKSVFKVRTGERDLGLRRSVGPEESPEAESDNLAAEYVQQLERFPSDTETREKLAMLYAEQFGRLDLAVDQLEQLAVLSNETPKHIAHWLDLLATLHIRYGHNIDAAATALSRIIEVFPNTASASRAVARLATLQGELKAAATTTAAKALGVYEKDVGLKSR